MSEDERDFVMDMLKTEGWRILKRLNNEQVQEYRRLATQAPAAVSDTDRTWFSGKAEGLEEAITGIEEKTESDIITEKDANDSN